MFVFLLSFFTGCFGLIYSTILIIKNKSVLINKYLIIIFIIISFRFIIVSSYSIFNISSIKDKLFLLNLIFVFMFALVYEYFNTIVEHDPLVTKRNKWYHFISFILIFIAFSLYYFFHFFNEHSLHLIFFTILISASIIYAYFEYHLLNTKLWNLKKKCFLRILKRLPY